MKRIVRFLKNAVPEARYSRREEDNMHRVMSSLALVVLALALTACSVTVTTPFDPPTEPVAATSDASTPAESGITLAQGETIWYEVQVSSSVAGTGDLLYLDVDAFQDMLGDASGTVEIRLYTSSGAIVATSTSSSGFGSGTSTLAASVEAQGSLSPQFVNNACLDACIIRELAPGTYIIRVRNISSSSVTADLYAYSFSYGDEHEEANDSRETSPDLNTVVTGAIETLGDEDYYYVNVAGLLTFSTSSPASLRAEVIINGIPRFELEPGEATSVGIGDEVRVYSAGGFAGPPAADGTTYILDVQQ